LPPTARRLAAVVRNVRRLAADARNNTGA